MTRKVVENMLDEQLKDFSAKFINKCRSNRCDYIRYFHSSKCPKHLYPMGGSMYCAGSIVNTFADIIYHINKLHNNILQSIQHNEKITKINSKNICNKDCTKNRYCIMYTNKKFNGLFCLKALKIGFVNYIKPMMIKSTTNKKQKFINNENFEKPYGFTTNTDDISTRRIQTPTNSSNYRFRTDILIDRDSD